MARPKKTVGEADVIIDQEKTEENTPEITSDEPKRQSKARTEFLAFIEAYKKQNPVKYELKREVLEAMLETL